MKVLVLTSSTGGGHDMRARSLKAWAEKERGFELDVSIFQTLEETDRLYRFGVDTYNAIQKRAPWAHHAYFNFLELAKLHKNEAKLRGRDAFIERIRKENPAVVLSTHAHLNHAYFALVREAVDKNKVRCVTYCGELFGGYGFSKLWVNPAADAFIGAVEATCAEARRLGMPEERNHVGGFLLNPALWQEDPPEANAAWFSEQFGLDPEAFTLVLATGANGANNHLPFLENLRAAGLTLQVVALCGRNENAQRTVQDWASRQTALSVRALPYFTDMPRLLRVASAIVARPGTGTTSESILTRCPVFFNGLGGIMPQEFITVKYLRSLGQPAVLSRPRHLPQALAPLLHNPGERDRYRAMMHSADPAKHPRDILALLRQLGEETA